MELLDGARSRAIFFHVSRHRLLLQQRDQPFLRHRRVAPSVLAVDAVLKVDWVEDLPSERDQLALAQQQKAVAAKRVMEAGQHPLLEGRVEIDEDVAANEQVESGDGRVGDEVVDAEHDRAADVLADAPTRGFLHEPGLEEIGRQRFDLLPRVDAAPREAHGLLVRIGAEDLHFLILEGRSHRRRQQDGDRKRLLASGTSRAPDADLFASAFFREHLGNHLAREQIPRLLIAKEPRDLDQHRREQGLQLAGVVLDQRKVLRRRPAPPVRHAPLDAAAQRGPLVIAEVEFARLVDALDDLFDRLVGGARTAVALGLDGHGNADLARADVRGIP